MRAMNCAPASSTSPDAGAQFIAPAPYTSQRGFTLLELVIAIAISSVVLAMMAMFLATPMQTYLAQNRRSELAYAVDSVQRMLAEDVRNALPNSLRTRRNGRVVVMEMLEVIDSARYRVAGSAGDAARELEFTAADTQFDTLGRFRSLTPPYTTNTGYLVVNHLGVGGANAYALTNVITPAGTTIGIVAGATPGEHHVNVTPGFRFIAVSPTQRVFLVSGPVAYLCDERARTLVRYSGYSMAGSLNARDSAAELLAAGASASTVAGNIDSCAATIASGLPGQSDLLGMSIQFVSGDDRLRLFRQFAVAVLP